MAGLWAYVRRWYWWKRWWRERFAPKMACPRRMTEMGPWKRGALDWWESDRWGTRLSRWWESQLNTNGRLGWFADRFLRRYKRFGGTCWLWPWQPRTCSFCGGVHPDDADRLIREGWRIERTTKSYKAYIEPAGGREEPLFPGGPTMYRPPWSAVPPVKAYGMHFPEGWKPPA